MVDMSSEEPRDVARIRTRTRATFPRGKLGSALNFLRFYVSRGYLPAVVFWAVVLLFAPVERIVYALTIGYAVLASLVAAAFHFFRARRRELVSLPGDGSYLGGEAGMNSVVSGGSAGGEEVPPSPS